MTVGICLLCRGGTTLVADEAAGRRPVAADLILEHGVIHTFDGRRRTVEALAIVGERIALAGSQQDVQPYRAPSTRVIDLQGHTVLPGLTDAHVHPIHGGLALLECDLGDIDNLADALSKLRAFATANPDKSWVRGANLSLALFADGNPHKRLLDDVIPDRPVFVVSADAHSAWLNSKALQLAGITADTPDPANGHIERDLATGQPSGTLREEAMSIARKVLPAYTHEEQVEALRRGIRLANSLGITNLIEASASQADIRAYLELAEKGELTVHANISIFGDISQGLAGAQRVLRLNEQYGRGRARTDDLVFGQAKLFMDGVVEGKTAAMLEPYVGESHAGSCNTDPETANAVVAALDRAGLQLHVHAIGDRAIRVTLDAFQHARNVNGIRDARHHIAHLHVVHPDDIGRFQQLGVTANFQPLWATLEDSYMTKLNFPFLGPKRAGWQYPIGSVARTGARLAFGSDWPVSTMNPFRVVQVAVNRRGPDRVVRERWTPEHAIDVQTGFDAYALGGAWLTFRESECGSLEPGKLADLVVVDRDVLKVSSFELCDTQVEMTLFRGRIVYQRGE